MSRKRWWSVTMPTGARPSTSGIWRNPPTAILWIDTAPRVVVRRTAVTQRDMAKPADGHLVDRHRDAVVGAQDDRVDRHDLGHRDAIEVSAGQLPQRVALGEDADHAASADHDHRAFA